jgi:tetratricopeptide (TPR) repeat protein
MDGRCVDVRLATLGNSAGKCFPGFSQPTPLSENAGTALGTRPGCVFFWGAQLRNAQPQNDNKTTKLPKIKKRSLMAKRSARDKAHAHARAARRHAAFGNVGKARAHWKLALEYRRAALGFGAPRTVSVCGICLDSDPPPIQRGCACRGEAGLAHIDCMVKYANATEDLDSGAAWMACGTCKQLFTGKMRQALGLHFWQSVKGLPPGHEKRQTATLAYARCHVEEGRFEVAENLARELLATGNDDKRMFFAAHSTLSQALLSQGKLAEAEKGFREARSAAGGSQDATSRHFAAQATGDLATVLGKQGKHVDAEKEARSCVDQLRRLYGNEHSTTLAFIGSLANHLMNQDKLDEAEALYREVHEAQTKVLGKEHPFTLNGATNLGRALFERKKYAEAEVLDRNALAAAKKLGEDVPLTLSISAHLASTLGALGKHKEANELFRDTLARHTRIRGSGHADTRVCAGMYDEYLKANPKKEAPSLVGAKVTLHGLNAAEYNGREGTVVGLDGERHTVDLGAKLLKVKRENFRVHCSYPQCTKTSDATSACATCRSILYCCRECQRAHWPAHKPVCVAKKR